jgi:hypothetical protein
MRAELATAVSLPQKLASKLSAAAFFHLHKKLWIIVLLFGTAFGIRLYGIDEPPLNFHAVRQYRSMIIARGYYFSSSGSVNEHSKQVALFSQNKQGILEPPIMEFVTSVGYRILVLADRRSLSLLDRQENNRRRRGPVCYCFLSFTSVRSYREPKFPARPVDGNVIARRCTCNFATSRYSFENALHGCGRGIFAGRTG